MSNTKKLSLNQAFPKDHLTSSDFIDHGKKEIKARILSLEPKEMFNPKANQKESKWILRLQGVQKFFILNITNAKKIAEDTKLAENLYDWPGQVEVVLHLIDDGRAENGKGIRVKSAKVVEALPKQTAEEATNDLRGGQK